MARGKGGGGGREGRFVGFRRMVMGDDGSALGRGHKQAVRHQW